MGEAAYGDVTAVLHDHGELLAAEIGAAKPKIRTFSCIIIFK